MNSCRPQEVPRFDRDLREPADRERRTAERERRNDRVHPAAVRESEHPIGKDSGDVATTSLAASKSGEAFGEKRSEHLPG